jgi:predicted O-methyltransferase YrrM
VRAWLAALPFVPRIPATSIEQLLPGAEDVEVTMRHETRDRALGPGEAYVLSLVAAWSRPKRIFEIGTASGQATLLMARQAPDARIDTLDLGNERPTLGQQRGQPPWKDLSTVGAAYREGGVADRVTQHFADSARFDFAPFRGQIDLVLVDGAHTYEYVRSDSQAALQMIRPGGIVVWDDCTYVSPGVSRALVTVRRGGHDVYRVTGTRLAVLRTLSP